GCSNPKTGQVTGKVLLDGRPLEGGVVTFYSQGKPVEPYAGIGTDGTYTVEKAPVGEVKISVASPSSGRAAGPNQGKMGMGEPAGPPKDGTTPKQRKVPPRYNDPASSGLSYTVVEGEQTHDLKLSSKPGAP